MLKRLFKKTKIFYVLNNMLHSICTDFKRECEEFPFDVKREDFLTLYSVLKEHQRTFWSCFIDAMFIISDAIKTPQDAQRVEFCWGEKLFSPYMLPILSSKFIIVEYNDQPLEFECEEHYQDFLDSSSIFDEMFVARFGDLKYKLREQDEAWFQSTFVEESIDLD